MATTIAGSFPTTPVADPAPAPAADTYVPENQARGQHGKVTTSYTIFLIVVAIVFLAIAVVFAINTYFYDKIRKNGCASSISKSEAEVLYWINLVLAIIAGIMFIVSIILIFTETKAPSYATKYLGRLKYQTESGDVIGLGEAGRRAVAAGYASGAGLARRGYASAAQGVMQGRLGLGKRVLPPEYTAVPSAFAE